MPDNVDKLFEIMQAKGAASDRGKFRKVFLTPGNKGYKIRKDIYDGLRADGIIDSPTYEDFRRKLRLGGTPTVNKYRQQMFNSVDPNKSRASELTHRAVSQAKRAMNNVRKPVRGAVVNKQGKKVSEFDITPAKTLDDLNREYAHEVTNDWEKEQQRQSLYNTTRSLDEVQRKIAERDAQLDEADNGFWTGIRHIAQGMNVTGGMFQQYDDDIRKELIDPKYKQYLVEANYLTQMKKQLIQEEEDAAAPNATKLDRFKHASSSFTSGMLDEAFGSDAFDFGGYNKIRESDVLLRISDRINRGVATDDDRRLLQILKDKEEIESRLDNDAYSFGRGASQSAGFVTDFLITGGGDFGGLGRLGGKMALGLARKTFAKTMTKDLGKRFAAWSLKNLGKTLGEATGAAMTATSVQVGKTAANATQRYLGLDSDDGGLEYDKDGNLKFKGGTDAGTAIAKAIASGTIENYTELLGPHITSMGKRLFGWAGVGLEKITPDALSKFFDKVGSSELFKRIGTFTDEIANSKVLNAGKKALANVGVNDMPEEGLEEEAGIILNSLITGDNKFSDLWDKETQYKTWGGVMSMMGAMRAIPIAHSAVGTAYSASKNKVEYFKCKHDLTKAETLARQALGDKWTPIKELIDNADNKHIIEVGINIIRQSDKYSQEQAKAAQNYIGQLLKMRGFNNATMASIRDKNAKGEGQTDADKEDIEVSNSYAEGHEAEGELRHLIQLEYEKRTANLAKRLGLTPEKIDAMNVDSFSSYIGLNSDADFDIFQYKKAKAAYDGVMDNAQNLVDIAGEVAAQRVDNMTNVHDGTIRKAYKKGTEMNPDSPVYIISGNIKLNDDGSINYTDSDKMLVVYDEETGQREAIGNFMLASVDPNMQNAEEVKAQAIQSAKQKIITEQSNVIDGILAEGSEFTMESNDGSSHNYKIVQVDEQGNCIVSVDGTVLPEPLSLDAIQQQYDQSNVARSVKNDQIAQESEQTTQEPEQIQQESQPIEDNFDYDKITNENDGKVKRVDVTDEEGKNRFPNAKAVFLIQDKGAMPKFVVMDEEGNLTSYVGKRGDKIHLKGEMTIEEYKKQRQEELQMIAAENADSSMIEDNSGTIEADRGGIEVEHNERLTFEDGTPIPVDMNGEVDLSQADAAHAAEWYDNNLGEDADDWLDGEIKKAKKVLEQAKNKKLTGTKPSELVASKKEKEAAIADAQAHYDSAISIRDSLKERRIAKKENTAEGRKELIEKARRKFARLKSSVNNDAEAVSQLYRDTVGSLLHRLYDSTGVDVFDDTTNTVDEYVAANVAPYSLNYEGNENSKGVQQETGLSRSDFAKLGWLAKDGKGTTIDAMVHHLWDNRPSNLENADTQEIRNALLGLITSGQTAFESRNYIQNQRIDQAEKALEEQQRQEENAAYAEQQRTENTNEQEDAPEVAEQTKFPDKLKEGSKAIEVPEDATEEKPLGEQRTDSPFSARKNGKQQTEAERAADVEKNKVDDVGLVDAVIGEKIRKSFERIAKMMGAKIQYQRTDKLGNGWIQETTDADGNVHRTIFITLDSSITEGAQFIFGHEMTHQIKNLNPTAYNELTQLVLDTYGSDAFDKAVDETMQRYSDAGFSGRNRDYYAEEVVADSVGEMIRDLNLAHTLAMKMSHPLLAAIHEILQKIKLAFFGTEYSDVTKNIIRSIEQAYVKTAKGEVTNSETGEDVSYSLRQKPEPKKKGIGYKVFVLKDGKLYPPMVANPDGAATPVGVWLDADAAPIAGESKTGRPQVKQGGKGTQGGSGKLAYRPGWHLGVVPYAIQFNRKDAEGNKTLFPKNFVFAEVEYAADVDYQEEARKEGINSSGKYQHSLAGLKHLPTDGYYMYRTNPNPETDPWVITGAMKVNRILTRAEQAELVKNAGREPQQIQEGDIVTDDVVNSINQEIADAPKFSLKVYHGSGADFTEFDFDHMGEGAGSQAFGWGGYVTSSKKIGKDYARLGNETGGDYQYMGETKLTSEQARVLAVFVGLPAYKEYSSMKEGVGAYIKSLRTLEQKGGFMAKHAGERIKVLESVLPKLDKVSRYDFAHKSRNLYEVDIPDDNGSNYIEFYEDATPEFKEQIKSVLANGLPSELKEMPEYKEAERKFYEENGTDESFEKSLIDDALFELERRKSNGDAYNALSVAVGDKLASKILSSLGYTGIKYPAGTIMGGVEGDETNYVIFKPEDMRITEHTKFSLKSKPVRFEAGKKLSDEEKKEVLSTLKDAYKVNGVPYHIEETAGGKEKRVYEPTADSYVVSDITNRPLRYYITLPDGRVAHPTEVYPNISDNEVKSSATKQGLLDDEADQIVSAAIGNMKDIADNAKAVEVLTELQNLPHETHDVGYGMNNVQSYNYKTGIFTSDAAQAIDYVVRRMRRKEDVSADIPAALKKAVADSYGMVDNLIDGMSNTKGVAAEIKPVGVGSFGNIYNQFRGNAKAAIEFLKKVRGGEAVGALHHKDIGDIDLVWGKEGTGHSDGYGLSKLVKYHPEVLDNLQEILNDMRVVSSSKNRVNLESETHKAGVRLTWDGERKSWLLTAFKKETSASDKRTDTAATSLEGDTALSQTEGSAAKIDNSSETSKENGEKVEVEGTKFSLKDEEYLKAVEDGNMEKAQKMVNEAADAAGYSTDSSYQGTSAFNGAAPWGNGYFLTKDERKEAWDNGEFEGESTLGDYINDDIDGGNLEELTNAASYRAADPMRKEAIGNVRNAIQKKAKTITMYRSVPSDVKEGSFRNGDWVTPSRAYAVDNAKLHGWGDDYNIIEQKVPVDDVWFDGNDIAEWGYGREEDYINDTDFAYKNSKNNKKLLDAVTYDDNGNVIPLSQRFNEKNKDVRFSLKDEKTMFGMHNISLDKLRKAIKQGGFAAPSMGVIDSKNGIYSGYGEITLIPKAEKIAKRTGKNIGTYAADAWTPIYPPVEKKFGGNGGDVAYDDIESVPKEMQRLTRNAINSFMDGREANGLAYLYLHEKGKAPELVHVEGKYPKELHDEVKGILGKLNGIYNTTDEQKEKLLDLFIREVYDGNKEEFDNDIKKFIKKDEEFIKKRPNSNISKDKQLDVDWMKEHGYDYGALSRFVDGILRDAETSGKVNENATMKAAQQYIQDNSMKEDFDSWKEKLNDRYNVEEVIFAGYKPDGNRKYLPNTVENAVKVMKQDGKNASVGSASFSHFVASILKPMGTLDQIRKKKGNLTGNYEDVEKFQEKWQPVYDELADKMQPDAEPFESYGMDRLEEAATQKNPKKYAKDEYGVDLTDEDINKLNELIEAVKNDKPSIYFETKFMRPYGLDEFEKAIVPNDTPSDVVDALKMAGIDVSSYERGNAEDRQKVTMDAINSSDNIRFSLKQTNDKFNSDLKSYVENGVLPENSRFELGFPSDILLSAGFPKLPISMRVSLLNKKAGMERHPFSPTDLYNLADAIQKPLAIFEYTKPNMRNLIVGLTKGEKHFLIGVTLDYRKGDLAVNSISGLFPKENHEWIKWIQDGKAIRIDKKDKVLSLINSLRTNPEEAERIGLNLDSAAKIIKDFENPSVSSENSSSDTKFSLRGSTSYDKQMEEWKEKNHLDKDAAPMEKPIMKEGENIFDYANRMVEWTRNQNLWKTAPKQTGFQDALEKWKADNGLSPDAYPPVRPHRENYSTEIGYAEDLEEYNKKKELWKSAPKPKDFDLSVDLEDMNKQLRNIRRAVLNQKNYDQRTVKAVSDLVRKMLNIGWGDGLSRGKVGNLLSAAKNATGSNDVKKYLDKAMGILAENYLNRLSTAYDNLINTKGARADQSGVIKMGSLDAKGQAFMSEYKKAINMDDKSLNTYIANIEEDSAKNEDNVEMNDYRLAGIQAAIMFKQQIGGNDADIAELQRQIGELKNKKDATKEDKDLLKSLEKKLFENKFDRITMYENLLNNIQRMVKESKGRAKEFREEIAEHKNEILHRANLDLEGVDSTYYDTTTAKKKLVNNDLQRAVFSSTYTFEQFLKFFGKKAANGEGYLYNYFTKLNQDALDEEQLYNEMNRNALDEKTKELFGKKKFMKLVGIDGNGMKEMDVEVTDYSNKETGKRTIHLKQGQMLYIYLVNKETDGEMKLRAMGITEEDVAAIEENLDPRVKAMGEWLQDEYLPECQRRYQATHTKYFGAPMKEVENYFPLAINNRARNVKEDVNQDSDAMSQLAGTSTGAIVTRRVNVIPLDIENADAFEVAFNHLQEMEEWSAMLPFRQDINTLLSYTHFRNQVQNMSSVAYGSGKTLWDEFKQTAQIAAGTYKPKVNAGMMDSRIAAAMGGIAVAKISGRLWTAIKQSQSATIFLPECDFTRFVKNGVNPYGSWKWAMENIPDFRKRVENMTYGDVKLRQYLDELEKWHDWTKTISKIGMAPNILVDGITCAVGARSVYETEVNRLTKLGYPKEKAEEKAYYKAVAAYNKTQQSSGGMYLSPMQVDRTYVSAALSLFKNANYAYGRMQIEACRGLARTYDFWGGKHKTTLVESMTRQIMEEDGLDENTARAIAKATYNRTFRQSIGRLVNFATLVPVSWALYKVLPYLLTGDDDDKKKDMIEEAVLKGFATSLSDNYVIPFASNILNAGLKVEDGKPTFDPEVFRYQNLYINPATSDLANIYSMIGNQKWYSVCNKVGMLGVQMLIGFNPETVGALYQALSEADDDNGNTAKEWQIGILKAISAPEESIRELYMDELGLKSEDIKKIPLAELEKRYAERQINRDNLLSQIFMDAEDFNGYVDKYKQSFEKKIKDKMDKWDEYDKKKADEFFDTTSDPKLKDMIEKKRTKDANAAADEQIAKEGLNQEKKGNEPSEEAYDAVKMSIDVAEDNAISTYNKVLNKRYAALNDEYNNQTDAMKYIFMSKHPNFKAYKELESEYTNYGKKIKELKEKLVSADGYDAKQTILKQIRAEREKFSELQSKVR